jgi:hypothetical protein
VTTYWPIPNEPLGAASPAKHGRPQWRQCTERGVLIGDPSRVAGSPSLLLPRVVIRGEAAVRDSGDFLCIGPIGSRADYLTVTWWPRVIVTTGCFTGPLEDFEAEVREQKPVGTPGRRAYEAAIALIRVLAEARGASAPAPAAIEEDDAVAYG